RDVQRDPPRLLRHDLERDLVAGTRRREDRARVERRRERRRATVRQTRRKRRESRRTRVDVVGEAGGDEIHLPRRAVAAAMDLAVEHDAGTEARTDREEDEVVDPARDTEPMLAERREVDVVVERDRQLEAFRELVAQRPSLEAREVRE